MAKIVALFNNKGGVSKTTTTFQLGWMLAELGKRTLIVDSDPQCNLTGLSINNSKGQKFEDLYGAKISNIKSILSPIFENKPEPLEAAECYQFKENKLLYLLPGHIGFSDYDTSFNIAQSLTGSLKVFQNVPGALRNMLDLTSKKYNLDFILVDMSPNISATNANILMQSDYFIVPCAPDYFCYMAIESLTTVFPSWHDIYSTLGNQNIFKNATYKIKNTPPLFIGTVQQRYRPRNGDPARAFAEWIKDINGIVSGELVPILKKIDMYDNKIDKKMFEEDYNLVNIADFNSLIAQSQIHNVPVYSLTQEQVGSEGKVWINMKKNIDDFHDVFEKLAHKVIHITNKI